MTNRSLALINNVKEKSYEEKIEAFKYVTEIEFKKIMAQAKVFNEKTNQSKLVNDLIKCSTALELFTYLNRLSVVDISILASYRIDVSYMNILKVSEY